MTRTHTVQPVIATAHGLRLPEGESLESLADVSITSIHADGDDLWVLAAVATFIGCAAARARSSPASTTRSAPSSAPTAARSGWAATALGSGGSTAGRLSRSRRFRVPRRTTSGTRRGAVRPTSSRSPRRHPPLRQCPCRRHPAHDRRLGLDSDHRSPRRRPSGRRRRRRNGVGGHRHARPRREPRPGCDVALSHLGPARPLRWRSPRSPTAHWWPSRRGTPPRTAACTGSTGNGSPAAKASLPTSAARSARASWRRQAIVPQWRSRTVTST